MTRCSICDGILWFWQRQGFRTHTEHTDRWHSKCYFNMMKKKEIVKALQDALYTGQERLVSQRIRYIEEKWKWPHE